MLSNFAHPVSLSGAVEIVQPVQEGTPYNPVYPLVPAFELPDRGGKPEDEEKKNETENEPDQVIQNEHVPEIFKLALNVNFHEVLAHFLTLNHEEIIAIRSEARQNRSGDMFAVKMAAGLEKHDPEKLRDHLYRLQMSLFHTPIGHQCHLFA